MPDLAVCVSFAVRPDRAGDFLDRVRAQARASLDEPGCRIFEVWTDPARPRDVFLWEVYADDAAFRAHLRTPHFRAFDVETAGMIESKTVITWSSRADA